MKKIVTLGLALALTLSLAACGGGKTDPTPTPAGDPTPGADPTPAVVSDLDYVKGNGTLKIGYTDYPPMNYFDDKGEFVGFETEFAKAVCEKLGVEPEFVEIEWSAKVMELEAQRIDCIWNGMTITPELVEALSISDPYIKNYQVVVIRAADADKYQTTADLAAARLQAEAGSAGESAIADDADLSQAPYDSVIKQTDALLSVKAGQADACVLDFVLAGAMVGQGDYSDLVTIPDLQLSVEEYGVAFRPDSDITAQFNTAMADLIADGTLGKIAQTYALGDLLLANQ